MDENTQQTLSSQMDFNDIVPGIIPEAVRDNEGIVSDGEAFALSQSAEILVEPLAQYAHDAWSGWMEWQFQYAPVNPDGSFTIPAAQVKRWQDLMHRPYATLSESEKDADRQEARAIIQVLYDTLK